MSGPSLDDMKVVPSEHPADEGGDPPACAVRRADDDGRHRPGHRQQAQHHRTARPATPRPAIREQLRALDDEVLKVVSSRASAFAAGAVFTLAEIMAAKATPPAARVSAAGRLIDVMLKVAELTLSELIERLEERFSGGTKAWPRIT